MDLESFPIFPPEMNGEIPPTTPVSVNSKTDPFSHSELLALASALASAASHQELTGLFREAGLPDDGNPMNFSKPKRIFNAVTGRQNRFGTGNYAIKFAQVALAPHRFVTNPELHESVRQSVNEVLAFRGLLFDPDGRVRKIERATTISEAKERANRLKAELGRRNVHPDVLAFCQEEYLQENYFHAVLEATKSLSEKIRQRTGLTGDAGHLAQQAFGLGQSKQPLIAFNSLRTETHESEQKGLMNLFVGMFGAFRNVTAHGPKRDWEITESDALDLLTLASLLHRRVDQAKSSSYLP